MDLNSYIGSAKQHKERVVADIEDDDDIPPIVAFERLGHLVAVVFADRVDRDAGLFAVQVGVPGFNADAVVATFDSHYSHSMTNPATGEAWAPGEMQNACDHEGACDIGVTQDALLVTRCERRHTKLTAVNLPYHVDKTSHTVHWLPAEEVSDKDTAFAGLVPDTIRATFEAKPDIDDFRRLNPDINQATLDEVAARLLTVIGMTVANVLRVPR